MILLKGWEEDSQFEPQNRHSLQKAIIIYLDQHEKVMNSQYEKGIETGLSFENGIFVPG